MVVGNRHNNTKTEVNETWAAVLNRTMVGRGDGDGDGGVTCKIQNNQPFLSALGIYSRLLKTISVRRASLIRSLNRKKKKQSKKDAAESFGTVKNIDLAVFMPSSAIFGT